MNKLVACFLTSLFVSVNAHSWDDDNTEYGIQIVEDYNDHGNIMTVVDVSEIESGDYTWSECFVSNYGGYQTFNVYIATYQKHNIFPADEFDVVPDSILQDIMNHRIGQCSYEG